MGLRFYRKSHRLKPGTTAINGWTLVFDLNRTITSSWSAVQKSKSGSTYTFTNESWTGNIPACGSVSFGIQVDGTAKDALLTNAKLNGSAIASSTTATPADRAPIAATARDRRPRLRTSC